MRRKPAYGRRARGAPWRWAASVMRTHWGIPKGQACHLLDGRRPTVAESIRRLTPQYDELPPVLLRHDRHRDAPPEPSACECNGQIPVQLPMVPPRKTLRGKLSRAILCREEFLVYQEAWRTWTDGHPEYATDTHRHLLHAMCMGEMLLHRITLVIGRSCGSTLWVLYHRTHLHLQRVRRFLGATRRQRLETGIGAGSAEHGTIEDA